MVLAVQLEEAGWDPDPEFTGQPLHRRDGLVLDCASQGGFERYLFLVAPRSTAARDPDGGVLVSLDMVVDPALAVGERYDSAAALELMSSIASDLAAAASPGGAPSPAPTQVPTG